MNIVIVVPGCPLGRLDSGAQKVGQTRGNTPVTVKMLAPSAPRVFEARGRAIYP